MYWAGDRLGSDRMQGAYAYKDLLEQNGMIALGTDFPIEGISPLKTFMRPYLEKTTKDILKMVLNMPMP